MNAKQRNGEAISAGNALRRKLFGKIVPVLSETERVSDSQARLMIQANCLDMMTLVEELIEVYGLDSYSPDSVGR